ncbi:MAG: glycine cleavage system aminomethyltransferase GcvT [Acidimicrobiia bacterium]
MSEPSSRSPLHSLNEKLGARFVDFGGWEMPVQYESVLTEHKAVRSSAAWFDVSHLGRFLWRGAGASTALNRLLTNDVTLIEPGRTQYTLCLNEDGGIVDDLLIWQWDDEFYWVLPNASTHTAMMERFTEAFPRIEIEDLRKATAMVAIQGPEAPAALEAAIGVLPKRFRTYRVPLGSSMVHLAGTGYTGERGGEVVAEAETTAGLLETLGRLDVKPAGLGARDTLRLEAGLLLAGQDFDTQDNPMEAGLDFAVSWNHEFVGRAALEALREAGLGKKLAAFTLPGRRIPRHGYKLRASDSSGIVSSGNFSPMLECGIGLGYLSPPSEADVIEVEIRGSWEHARRVELPFLKR